MATGKAERLAAIQARLAAATPGPWEAENGTVWGPADSGFALYGTTRTNGQGEQYGPLAVTMDGEYVQSKRFAEDADLIAHARDDLAWLLAEVARLRALVGEA